MPKTTLIDCCIKKYAYREVSQIYQELEISGEGLSQSQVELMREKYGINSFSQRRNDTMLYCQFLSVNFPNFFFRSI